MTPSENLVSIFTILIPNLIKMRGLLIRIKNERNENALVGNQIRLRGPPLQTQWQLQGFASESSRNESDPTNTLCRGGESHKA